MERLDAVLIATDLYREVPGVGFRDEIRLSIQDQPATMEFLLEYFRAGKDGEKAAQRLRKSRQQRVPLPLNGPYLHQYLGRRGLKTDLVPFFSLQKDRLLELLREHPRAVVISTTFFPFAPQIESVAAFVREHAPEIPIIAGGIQIWKSYRTRELLENGTLTKDIRDSVIRDHYLLDLSRPSLLDFLVVSDRGEHSLSRLLYGIRRGDVSQRLDNVAYFTKGKWHLNPVRPEPYDFLLEPMDWSQLPSEFTREEIPVHAGTGCPFRCEFCDFCTLRSVRRRPIASIVEEIRSIPLVDEVRQVFFTDDNLCFSSDQLKDFCNALIEGNLALRWRAFVRADTIKEETADLLRRSGCWECLLGVESGDEEILRKMNKKTNPETILRAISSLNRAGINTQSTFLVGFPGETDRSIQNTIDLLNAYPTDGEAIHVHYPFFFLVAPLARVASRKARAKYQLKGYLDEWSHYTMTSREAEQHVGKVCDSVKMEISPIYHGERVVSWLSPEELKRVIFLRNKINRLQRGIIAPESEEPLWNEMEEIFASATKGSTGGS
jgi:p-methyltransferase